IQWNTLATLIAVNIEAEVVCFPTRLPKKYDTVGSGLIFAALCGEEFQLDVGRESDGFDLSGSVGRCHLIRGHTGCVGCGPGCAREGQNRNCGSGAVGHGSKQTGYGAPGFGTCAECGTGLQIVNVGWQGVSYSHGCRSSGTGIVYR